MISDDPAEEVTVVDEEDGDVPFQGSPADESPLPDEAPEMDAPFLNVVEIIEKEFAPQIIRDDGELASRLFTFLTGKFPGRVQRDVMGDGTKTDIVLDDSYGFELKVIRNEGVLRDLVSEVASYTGQYRQMAVVLFVDRLYASRIDLEQFTDTLDQYGVVVIVKQGMIEAI